MKNEAKLCMGFLRKAFVSTYLISRNDCCRRWCLNAYKLKVNHLSPAAHVMRLLHSEVSHDLWPRQELNANIHVALTTELIPFQIISAETHMDNTLNSKESCCRVKWYDKNILDWEFYFWVSDKTKYLHEVLQYKIYTIHTPHFVLVQNVYTNIGV